MAIRTKEQLKQIFVEQAVLTEEDFHSLIDSLVSKAEVSVPEDLVSIYLGDAPPNGWRKLVGEDVLIQELSTLPVGLIYIIKDAAS